MTLSPLGKQYICKNFGDTSLCCVRTGLSWYYTVAGTNYNETGGTAQIVSRLASGLIDSLTMTSPARGAFTKAQLDEANAGPVTLQDAKEITYHDEPTEVQWCFIPCEDHPDQTTCEDVYLCYWWNNGCHTNPPTCGELNNQSDCLRYECFWYNGACHSAVVCADILIQTECEAHGCHWWNGACHALAPSCEELNNQPDCLLHGCFWYNGACHSAVVCADILIQTECEAHGCYWYNGACHALAPSCEELLNEPDCSRYGCYWFRGVCHSVDQPDLCYWIDAQGGPDVLTITNVFAIIDAYTLQQPPTGYTFIPTIVNTFGVVDYYLGFNGDAKTGCAYY